MIVTISVPHKYRPEICFFDDTAKAKLFFESIGYMVNTLVETDAFGSEIDKQSRTEPPSYEIVDKSGNLLKTFEHTPPTDWEFLEVCAADDMSWSDVIESVDGSDLIGRYTNNHQGHTVDAIIAERLAND